MSKLLPTSLEELRERISELNLDIPVSEDLTPLQGSVSWNGRTIPNAIAVHPMEGADGETDGSPSELVFRRYKRFAQGGAGLIWVEAVAVVNEGRANPRQLHINANNKGEFRRLVEEIKRTAKESWGSEPLIIIQLTHSGRYSKPQGKPEPMIAYHNAYLDKAGQLDQDYPLVTDSYLERLADTFRQAAGFAKEAGFDGVDIKCSHGYLIAELLSAYSRPGKFGGDYIGRTRLLRQIVQQIHADHGEELLVGARLNLYDGLAKPDGWGATVDGTIDFSEPGQLVRELVQDGVGIFNATAGNPYYQPHINRPYSSGGYEPPEHQLAGVERLLSLSRQMQEAAGVVPVVGVGFSYLRALGPYVAAGAVSRGDFKLAGFGRQAFAYPDFAKDIFNEGELDSSKVCITCSGCTKLMRAGHVTGCMVRDQYYQDLWRKLGVR